MSTPKWLFPLIFKRDVLQVADPAMASFKTSKHFRSFPENPHIFEGPFWDISQHQWHKLAIASAPAAETAVHSDPGSRHIPRPLKGPGSTSCFSDDSLMPKSDCFSYKRTSMNNEFMNASYNSPLRLTNCLTVSCSPSPSACLQQLLHLLGITQVFGCHPCCLQSLLIACWWRTYQSKAKEINFFNGFSTLIHQEHPFFPVSSLTPIQTQVISLASLFPIVFSHFSIFPVYSTHQKLVPKAFPMIPYIHLHLCLVKSPRQPQHGLKIPRHSWINEKNPKPEAVATWERP